MVNCDLPQRAFAKAVPGLQGKNQDATSVLTRHGVTALAVADGVTSAGQYAGLGAQSAATSATAFLTEKFDEIVVAEEDRLRNYFFSYFRTYYLQELNAAAGNAGLPPVLEDTRVIFKHFRLYSTTIIACAVREDQLLMMKIGNGSIAADTGMGFGVVSPSKLVRGQTPCIERLFDPGFSYFSFRRYLVPGLTCLVLMSDGVEHTAPLLYDEINQRLTQDFPDWLQEAARTEESFSAAVEQLGRTGEDDVAVAVLVRGEADLSPKPLLQENPFADCELYQRSAAPAKFGYVHREPALPTAVLTPSQNSANSSGQPAIDVPGPGSELQESAQSTAVLMPSPQSAGSTFRSSIDVPGPGSEFRELVQPTTALVPSEKSAGSDLRSCIDILGPGLELQEPVRPTTAPVSPLNPVGSVPHSSIDVPDPELKPVQSVSSDGAIQLNTTPIKASCDEHFQGPKHEKINTHASDSSKQNTRDAAKRKEGEAAMAEDAEPSDEGIGSLKEVNPTADTQSQDSGTSGPNNTNSRRFLWDNKPLLTALLFAALATVIIVLALLHRL